MRYGKDDLKFFALVANIERLEGTAYFELHPGDLPEPTACWLPGSLFVKDSAFDFFAACFESANPRFDYFAFERFDPEQVQALLANIADFVAELASGCSRSVVFSRFSSPISASIWDDVGTDDLRSAIVNAASGMSTFVRDSCSEQQCLWVLGM